MENVASPAHIGGVDQILPPEPNDLRPCDSSRRIRPAIFRPAFNPGSRISARGKFEPVPRDRKDGYD
jgi:hypothetical protein